MPKPELSERPADDARPIVGGSVGGSPAGGTSTGGGSVSEGALDRPPILLNPGVSQPRRRRRRRPVTDDTPISNADGLFGPGYPVLPTKVQRPPLRAETLSRPRLTDWLSAHVHHRVVFITAEAGYGKTTLLADFARHTRLRVLWYRIDEQDRDWIAVLNYLVAAGREVDADFAIATAALLSRIGTGTATRERVVETFLRELQQLGSTRTVLVFDDWHLIDGVADVRDLMRQVIVSAPEKMSFVFASRWRPTLSVARFRARGEVAELTTKDLRFSESEVDLLFRETYGRPLDSDILTDLSSRTEGWAASLQLIQTAIRDRDSSGVRSLIRELSGCDENLYDYLAEEVVGELDAELQQFLMRSSILQTVDPDLAQVVVGIDATRARQLIEQSERLGLLARRGEATRHLQRYHPLVRDFLEDRLRRALGADGVRDLHRVVARWADGRDWRLAAHHYEWADEFDDMHRVIEDSALDVMATGDYSLVSQMLERHPAASDRSIHHIARSRIAYYSNQSASALRDAESAVELARIEGSQAAELAQLNLISQHLNQVSPGLNGLELARNLAVSARDRTVQEIARAYVLMSGVTLGEPIAAAAEHVEGMARRQEAAGRRFFAGVSFLNLAVVLQIAAQGDRVLRAAERAASLLEPVRPGPEWAAALSVAAWAHAHRGDMAYAMKIMDEALTVTHEDTRVELLGELADLHLWYGSVQDASSALELASQSASATQIREGLILTTEAELALRVGDGPGAIRLLERFGAATPVWSTSKPIRAAYLRLVAARMVGREWTAEAKAAESQLESQGAHLWLRPIRLMLASSDRPDRANQVLSSIAAADSAALSMAAEIVVDMLPVLSERTFERVAAEARQRPRRWREALQHAISASDPGAREKAALLLDEVGEQADVAVLRLLSKSYKPGTPGARVGRQLARRLAARAYVEDQGRVRIQIAGQTIDGSSIRRKVLALLCYLLTKPGFSAARDQVLDALWPDQEPAVAANSLHQTIYFLRRVFDPSYKEEVSANYVNHDGDIVWLDNELVRSRSSDCAALIARLRETHDPIVASELSDSYRGQFALDFAYEDWAEEYRATQHASYIELIEECSRQDAANGRPDRSIQLLTRALEIDPRADHLELALVGLYRRFGAPAAAAERYRHYSSFLRDEVGIDPPPLESL